LSHPQNGFSNAEQRSRGNNQNRPERIKEHQMKHENVNRRDFSKWTMAAFGGFMSGAVIGCGNDETSAPSDGSNETKPAGDSGGGETTEVAAHGCRGLNECKSATNDCRGMSACATESWHHDCGTMHDCKGKAGCGENPLANDCKGQGGCHVPLMDAAWEKARENMEKKWEAAGLDYGDAPPPKS
jgi:hypothetical protein